MLSLDFFILDQLVQELGPALEGAKVAKIHQPAENCLVLRLWNGRENLRLLIQIGPQPRIHLTTREFPNPFQPPRFCQMLRARLRRLVSLRLPGIERIVELNFKGEDQDYILVCEMLVARSNLYLLDQQRKLLDAFQKPQAMGERLLGRQQPYEVPAPRQGSLLDDPQTTPPESLATAEQFEDWLQREVVPMSKGQARVLGLSAGIAGNISGIFETFRQAYLAKAYLPGAIRLGSREELVAYLPSALEGVRILPGGLNAFLDDYYATPAENQGEVGFKLQYRQLITAQLKRLGKRLEQISRQEDTTSSYDDKRQLGDLLLANLHLVRKGMAEVVVTDWQTGAQQEVTIPLDPQLNPQENAERLFKRYKKDKRGVQHVERRQEETRQEIDWFDGLLLSLDEAQSAADINEVGRELLEAGILKLNKAEAAHRRRANAEPLTNCTTSPAGLRILWGRNTRSNDFLSAKLTEKDDLWFHAHNMPGCHLVLKRDGRTGDLPDEDIAFAARIAAGYSRGKDAGKVEVIVTEGRHVSRPKGAKPGLVTLAEYRTIAVEPLRLPEAEKAQ